MLYFGSPVSFTDYSLEQREEMIERVYSELGEAFPADEFAIAVHEKERDFDRAFIDLDWDDCDYDAEGIEISDALYDNAGESLHDALFEAAAIYYCEMNADDRDWNVAVQEVMDCIQYE